MTTTVTWETTCCWMLHCHSHSFLMHLSGYLTVLHVWANSLLCSFLQIISTIFIGVGSWAYDDKRKYSDLDSLAFDPSVLIIIVGCLMFVITFCGCVGALRENKILLKVVSISKLSCKKCVHFQFNVYYLTGSTCVRYDSMIVPHLTLWCAFSSQFVGTLTIIFILELVTGFVAFFFVDKVCHSSLSPYFQAVKCFFLEQNNVNFFITEADCYPKVTA